MKPSGEVHGRGQNKPANRPTIPPPPEDAPMEDGSIIPDPRSAIERDQARDNESGVQEILDDDTRQQAEALGIIETGSAEQVAAQVAARLGKRRLTKAQVQRIRLTQQALSLSVQGYSSAEIAEHLGVSAGTVTGWFSVHRRDVQALDLDRQLDEIAVPLATQNLIHGLIAGDKDYTLETLKGRGKLKKTVEAGDEGGKKDLPVLKIVVEGGNAQINVGDYHRQTKDQIDSGGRVVGVPQIPKTVGGHVLPNPVESSGDANDPQP